MYKGSYYWKLIKILVISVVVFYSGVTQACVAFSDVNMNVNGCTDKGLNTVTRLSSITGNWTSFCNVHDRCYYKVGQTKANCDAAFETNLLVSCDKRYGKLRKLIPNYHLCRDIAHEYGKAVRGSSEARQGFKSSQKTAVEYAQTLAVQNCEVGNLLEPSASNVFISDRRMMGDRGLQDSVVQTIYFATRGVTIDPYELQNARMIIREAKFIVYDPWLRSPTNITTSVIDVPSTGAWGTKVNGVIEWTIFDWEYHYIRYLLQNYVIRKPKSNNGGIVFY